MRRPGLAFGVFFLAAAACGSGAEETARTTGAVVETQTTVAESATTTHRSGTTRAAGPVSIEIPGRALLWEAGATYYTDRFLVPLEFRPAEPGWRSLGADDELVHLTWSDSNAPGVSLTVAAHLPSEPVETVIRSLIDEFDVIALTSLQQVDVGGRAAVSVDVEAPPFELVQQRDECANETGRVGRGDGSYTAGFGECSVSRVWVVDVSGQSITVIGSTLAADRFEELMGHVERLLESMTFGAS